VKVAHENTVLQQKIAQQYQMNRDSDIVELGWGQPVDGCAVSQCPAVQRQHQTAAAAAL
jgi:hypothetical protein